MQPLDPRVEIGHVRLRVRDLDRALVFYAGSLGFEVTYRHGAAASQPPSAEPGAALPVPLSEASRQRLRDLRARLLNLHKVLLDDTKVAYEMDRGRVGSSGNLLQLVINDPWFAWLHPLSEL